MKLKFEGTVDVPDFVFEVGKPQPVATLSTCNLQEPDADLGFYAGKLVFIESDWVDSKGVKSSTYNNGEYACVRNTPGCLYAVKLSVGYDGHELKKFNLIGTEKYRVVDCYEADAVIRDHIRDQGRWSEAPRRGEKLQWVEYVYTNAATNVRLLQRSLEYKNRRK